MVKMLTVLVSTISNSQVFLLKKIYAIFNDQSFIDTLTNDIVSFEQLDPVFYFSPKKNLFALMDVQIPGQDSPLQKPWGE